MTESAHRHANGQCARFYASLREVAQRARFPIRSNRLGGEGRLLDR